MYDVNDAKGKWQVRTRGVNALRVSQRHCFAAQLRRWTSKSHNDIWVFLCNVDKNSWKS